MSLSSLYIGTVAHVRLQPFRHAFKYRVFSLLLDLDEAQALSRRIPVFSFNKFNLLSFHERDHADGKTPPKQWVITQLVSAGYAATSAWSIRLLCFPRMLGFVFNPLAIYFCHDEKGRLKALLHQVSNTFGERHSYLLPVPENGAVIQACAKNFHVSPFMPLDGGYRFHISPPGEKLAITIHYHGPDGADRLIATQRAERKMLTTGNLLKAFLSHPLMTLKVVAGIHWEALHLWRKGARLFRKPAPPRLPVSAPALIVADSIV